MPLKKEIDIETVQMFTDKWLLLNMNNSLKPYDCIEIICIRQKWLKPYNWL